MISFCFVSLRFSVYIFCFVSQLTDFASFRYNSLRFVSLCFVSVSFLTLQGPITLCWNIWFLVHYFMVKYLVSRVIRYAEISGFSFITLCWNIWFLVYYVMVKYLVSHLICYAEISGISFNILCWNIFLCNILCYNIRFLMHCVILKLWCLI